MENLGEVKEVSEQEVKQLYGLTVTTAMSTKESLELYYYKIIDLNQFITRISEISNEHLEAYNKITDNGEASLSIASNKVSK